MSLRSTLEKVLDLLSKYPHAENQAGLKASATKLQATAVAFQEALEIANAENSVSYAKLAGLINDPAKKKIVTLVWANAHLRRLAKVELSGKSLSAQSKRQFLLRIVNANAADQIIAELGCSEEEKLQDEFARISKLSQGQIEEVLDGLKGDKLEAFCLANSVPVTKKKPTKTGKVSLDRKRAYPQVLSALSSFRERQKL